MIREAPTGDRTSGPGDPYQLAGPSLGRRRIQVLMGQAVGSRRHHRPHVHDLRGTAVVRLAIARATVPQIATFTGHSLKDVEAILDAHYLGRDIQLAEAAGLKLEARTKMQTAPISSPIKTTKCLKSLVAESAKPVSEGHFPANRENNRVFVNFWPFRPSGSRRKPCATAVSQSVPYERYQGISEPKQGSSLQYQGFSDA